MNIKKISGTLAVVITMLGFNAAAQADCTDEIEKITEAADKLRCAYGEFAGGSWNNNPIWQKQAGKGRKKQDAVGDGCEVHQSLARHLYEKRDPERDSPPPKKRGNNVARGAAHALAEGKFQNAIEFVGIDLVSQTLPPITLFSPITVSPPRIVALAYIVTLFSMVG